LKFNRLSEEKPVGAFQDLRDVFKNLKHRRTTTKYCPCCGSPRLELAGGSDFWLTPGKHVCLDCGYKGFIVMEKEEDSEKEAIGR
jgi:hypothetical protein